MKLRRIHRTRLIACVLAGMASILLPALPSLAEITIWEQLDAEFQRDVLVIETAENGCFRFDIHLAISPDQQRRGLMHIRELPEWSGMLFIYRRAGMKSMWMKNTYVPLDIVFARADGSISSVIADTEPLSLRSLGSTEPVNFVLELNAGTSARLGIGAGSRLLLDSLALSN